MMAVHVGQLTSEVHATRGASADEASSPPTNDWEERARLTALLRRLDRDRGRVSTGQGDD